MIIHLKKLSTIISTITTFTIVNQRYLPRHSFSVGRSIIRNRNEVPSYGRTREQSLSTHPARGEVRRQEPEV